MARRLQVSNEKIDSAVLDEASKILQAGGLVAFPTETVYGIGGIAGNVAALEKLSQIKRRPPGKPFSYHVADIERLELPLAVPSDSNPSGSDASANRLLVRMPLRAQALADHYWPGPLTLVVPAEFQGHSEGIQGHSEGIQGHSEGNGETTVGVRIPAHEVARQLIRKCGEALFVPSANPAGEPPAMDADQVEAYFGDDLDLIIDGGTVVLKQASAVIQVDDDGFHILREGIITREMAHQLLEGRRILFVCTGNTCRSPMAEALYRVHLAEKLGKPPDELAELGYQISSAGTFAYPGGHVSAHAEEVATKRGGDLSGHRTRPVTPELLQSADRVYALGYSHLRILQEMAPDDDERFTMLSSEGITDPVGGDLATYERCADDIEEAIREHLARWS